MATRPDYLELARSAMRDRSSELSINDGRESESWRYDISAGVQLLAEAMERADTEKKRRDIREVHGADILNTITAKQRAGQSFEWCQRWFDNADDAAREIGILRLIGWQALQRRTRSGSAHVVACRPVPGFTMGVSGPEGADAMFRQLCGVDPT